MHRHRTARASRALTVVILAALLGLLPASAANGKSKATGVINAGTPHTCVKAEQKRQRAARAQTRARAEAERVAWERAKDDAILRDRVEQQQRAQQQADDQALEG